MPELQKKSREGKSKNMPIDTAKVPSYTENQNESVPVYDSYLE